MLFRTVKTSLMALAVSVTAGVLTAGTAQAACELEGPAAAGQQAINVCVACHTFEADRPSRPTGPNLHDVFGSPPAAVEDFPRYSDALKAAAEKGLVWDAESLDAYIADPGAFLTEYLGERMRHGMFFKLANAERRAEIVAFLEAIKGDPNCP